MVLILDNIRSVYNVGSIFRTADAAGVKKIYLCGITPEPIDRLGKPREKFIKVSLGAEKSVAWQKVKSASKLIDKLKNPPSPHRPGGGRYKIISVEQSKRAIPYYRYRKAGRAADKIALVFGNEVRGVSKAILKKSDKILEIPMYGRKESLNVAVSTGIILFGLKY